MRIGGLLNFSLIDYPGKMAAVIFTQGCNFRCPFCYNRELALPECFKPPIPEGEVLNFLHKRVGELEGVVITGGEPTIQPDLASFIRKIKLLGYPVKIDTNGTHPEILQRLLALRLVDYVAMDVKAPLERYHVLAGVPADPEKVQESIDIIINFGVPHEFRTTLVRPLLNEDDVFRIKSLIKDAQRYTLQKFIPQDTVLDSTLLKEEQFTQEDIDRLACLVGS